MKTPNPKVTHTLGANHGEIAKKARKHDANFSQSKDLHEDRGSRQIKNTGQRGQRP